jgi:hypothetical protein
MNEQKAASPPCSKTISGVTGDVKNRQLESKRILALMNASVKGNPSLERDFKRTVQNSANDSQKFRTTIALRHADIVRKSAGERG